MDAPLLSLVVVVVVGKPGTVVFLGSLPLILSFVCAKTRDPSPKMTT